MNIEPHIKDYTYETPHFFIQASGYTAGRPSTTPGSVSHVVKASDVLEKEMLFWICFGLWETNCFIKILDKTMPPKLDPKRAATLIDKTCKLLSERPWDFTGTVSHLKQLIRTEKLLSAQVNMVKKIKKSIAKKMIGH